jgi:hypothetical protein
VCNRIGIRDVITERFEVLILGIQMWRCLSGLLHSSSLVVLAKLPGKECTKAEYIWLAPAARNELT